MPYHFRAIAVDYDGTLTHSNRPTPAVLDALRATRAEGRKLVLLTGRILAELRADFPEVDREFDAIVGENGAVLWTPRDGERALTEPVSEALEGALRRAGIPVRRGQVILATDALHDGLVLSQIARLRSEERLVYNRGALMVLPSSVSKGTGLYEALGDLGISRHSVVGIGDAENDHTLLESCELGVAVANAVPSLQARADIVLGETDGEGVVAFLRGPVLRGEIRVRPRRWGVELGRYQDGSPALLPASQVNVLIAGGSTSGKSTLAGLLVEQLVAKGYSICVLDPEGDHVTLGELRGVLAVGGAEAPPPPERIATLLSHRFGSVVINLSRLKAAEKRRYTRALLAELQRLRAVTGLPHWIVLDEAPQLLGTERLPDDEPGLPAERFCLVTHRPEDLVAGVLDQIDILLALPGGEVFAARTGLLSKMGALAEPLTLGEAFFLERGTAGRFRIGQRRCAHVRHWHKYLSDELPVHRQFHLRTPEGPTGVSVANIEQFHHEVQYAPAAVLAHHLGEGDFSRWMAGVLSDGSLAATVGAIEAAWRDSDRATIEPFRVRLLAAIEARYRDGSPEPSSPATKLAPPAEGVVTVGPAPQSTRRRPAQRPRRKHE